MNGVILLCMHKPQYACAAYNLALSIRNYSPNVHITLLSDGVHNKAFTSDYFLVFNSIKEIKEQNVTEAKLNLYKYSDYDSSMYIDVDTICNKDILPLFDTLKGREFVSNKLENYTIWTTKEKFKNAFGFDCSTTINSSFIYWEKDTVFKKANDFYKLGFNVEDIEPRWGGKLPDELFFNAALSYLGVDSSGSKSIMWLDDKKYTSISEMQNYFFTTFYGNRKSSPLELQEWYDKTMFKICGNFGIEHRFKISEILAHKLVNDK